MINLVFLMTKNIQEKSHDKKAYNKNLMMENSYGAKHVGKYMIEIS